jgi:hypothetical protein
MKIAATVVGIRKAEIVDLERFAPALLADNARLSYFVDA